MTDRKVRAAYDKIRIDPNAAVRIWKNILAGPEAVKAAGEAESRTAAAQPQQAPETEQEVKRVPVIGEILSPAEEAEYAEAAETAEDFTLDGGELPEETEVPSQDEDERPEWDAEPSRSHKRTRASTAPRRSRSGGERGRSGKKGKLLVPIVLVAAAFILGILLFFRNKPDDVAPSPEMSGAKSEISVPVVTKAPVTYEGAKEDVSKISVIQEAMGEWNAYKEQAEQQYVAENLPSFTEFLKTDGFFDGVGVEENGDGTYSLVHWVYEEDWGNTSISPITGQEEPTLIQRFDSENSVTVEKDEYAAYLAYAAAKETEGTYGDYNYSYGVSGESDAAKLEEIAAAHGLTLRKGEGTNRGFGEAEDAALAKALSETAGKGDIYSSVPEIDYFTTFDNGAFNSMAEIKLPDGRRMYTLLCATPYTEMIDAVTANGITVQSGGEMSTRKYTSADKTELTISYNDNQAIVYAYLDNCYVVMDMGINAWRSAPGADDSTEALAAKQETDFTLNEEVINFTADYINYKNIGR